MKEKIREYTLFSVTIPIMLPIPMPKTLPAVALTIASSFLISLNLKYRQGAKLATSPNIPSEKRLRNN